MARKATESAVPKPEVEAPPKEAVPGAYDVWYRDEKRIMFNWYPKREPVPPDQKHFVDNEFQPITDQIVSYEGEISQSYLDPLLVEAKR